MTVDYVCIKKGGYAAGFRNITRKSPILTIYSNYGLFAMSLCRVGFDNGSSCYMDLVLALGISCKE